MCAAAELFGSGTADLDALAAATEPDDIATLIYTSGTTGPPKGVMISQYNIVYTIEILEAFDRLRRLRRDAGRVVPADGAHRRADVSHYQAMMLGYSVYCCPDPNQLTTYLKEVHPQLAVRRAAGVGEDLQRRQRRARRRPRTQGAVRRRGDRGDRDPGARTSTATSPTSSSDTWDFLDAVAFSHVRALVGLDAVELAITGAAPIPVPVLEWFNAIGVPLAEIYGMSETTGPMTCSPERPKTGTVGRAVPAWR